MTIAFVQGQRREAVMAKKISKSASRRQVLRGASAAAAVLAAPMPIRAQPKRIVYASWGGTWEKALRQAWFDPFTKKTGIEVVSSAGNSYGKLRAMVEAHNVEWDVVETYADFQFIGARDSLLEKLDFKVIDASKVMKGRNLVSDFSVPQVLFSLVIFYNTNQFAAENHPKSWVDIWDLSRFPGKRAFSTIGGNHGAFEAALLADGVPPEKLYPIDIDRALRSLSRIRDHIIWYNTIPQQEQYMTDGEAVTGLVSDGRALSAISHGASVAIDYNQSLLSWSDLVIPKGTPNPAAAMEFLNYTLTAEAQAALATAYTYGPVVTKAFDLLPPERAKILSGGPEQQGKYILVDEEWWGANLKLVTEKFNAWRLT
jgi:putative spermidine/putrescine transport system substrate-binding protein